MRVNPVQMASKRCALGSLSSNQPHQNQPAKTTDATMRSPSPLNLDKLASVACLDEDGRQIQKRQVNRCRPSHHLCPCERVCFWHMLSQIVLSVTISLSACSYLHTSFLLWRAWLTLATTTQSAQHLCSLLHRPSLVARL